MIQTGLCVLTQERAKLLADRRVGLVSHSAAILPDLTSIVDALRTVGANLRALFGAEHGFAGAAPDGAVIGPGVDRRTGLPVYSLYGPSKEPQPDVLAGLDVLVVDFQDVGARFYTFLSTLYYVLRAAGQAGLPVIVLDRPNPISGAKVEGPLIAPGFFSFVGIVSVPIRHGMTLGELALLMNRELNLGAPLTVIAMRGWRRQMWFDQTGLPWAPPSPAMPHLSTAVVYPGMCLVEGTNLSEGRGTALPFEIVGAPWLDGYALARQLNHLELPGARFRPHIFQPTASKHAGQVCEGVQVYVTDRARFEAVRVGLHVLAACRAQAPEHFAFLTNSIEGELPHFDLLAGSARPREHLQAAAPVDELVRGWDADLAGFARRREPYELYH